MSDRLMRLGFIVSMLLVATANAWAAPMSNADLETLLRSKVSEEVIEKLLASSDSPLDLSADAVVRLKAAGASDSLLLKIVERQVKPRQASPSVPQGRHRFVFKSLGGTHAKCSLTIYIDDEFGLPEIGRTVSGKNFAGFMFRTENGVFAGELEERLSGWKAVVGMTGKQVPEGYEGEYAVTLEGVMCWGQWKILRVAVK